MGSEKPHITVEGLEEQSASEEMLKQFYELADGLHQKKGIFLLVLKKPDGNFVIRSRVRPDDLACLALMLLEYAANGAAADLIDDVRKN